MSHACSHTCIGSSPTDGFGAVDKHGATKDNKTKVVSLISHRTLATCIDGQDID